MKEYEGKDCAIHIRRGQDGKDLFFNGMILDVDEDSKLLTFRDRYDALYTFTFKDILQINEKKNEDRLVQDQ